tara:strand:+ start:1256 stop:1726 length:471 start_codon:yes stop_codon:yes gene_type:complete
MSRYIPQINNQNFVYPNYNLAEYDVDITHIPNDSSVFGNITSVSATTISSSSITITYSGNWLLDGAERWSYSGNTNYLSIHVIAAGQNYYKPWRTIKYETTSNLSTFVNITNQTATFTPSQLGLSVFTTGTYYFEFRFIGANSIYPICQTLSITIP